ncbi:hypothetical protein [Streptomyces sp. NBC_01462]|nr:hypothetical protein [Streptomyces sp. NBC_01462]
MTYAHVGMATTMRVSSTKAKRALGRAPAYPSTYGRPVAPGATG